MAKIAKFDKYSSRLNKTVSADVYYHLEKGRRTSSTGFFYIELPTEVEELWDQFEHKGDVRGRGMSKKVIKGTTADQAMDYYIQYLVIFMEARRVVEKVILYRLKFSSKNKSSDPAKKKSFMDGIDHTYEAQLEFDYAVCDKINFNGEVKYKAHDEVKKNSISTGRDSFNKVSKKTGMSYGGWVELPYTTKSEAFFMQVYTGMENIMEKLMQFIGTDDAVLESIKKNQNLLA